ncbi:MAG: hypothetical protein A2762_01145 [Candidatus Lloydbacteria bacterium RIFCSPHIGHO2_01_FULL_54_11]|nr:MAG: hypothetical protein A2762_01145 [Candidatus Lloydbacteria bacterium RIFCSPHIGHO2_01_FULL_54_11]
MSACFPECVRVIFDEYDTHVPYAADLAERLNIPLTVYAPIRPEMVDLAGELLHRTPSELDDEMIRSVKDEVQKHFREPERAGTEVSLAELPRRQENDAGILVSCETDGNHTWNVLSPAGERRIFRTNKGPVLIPLGDGMSSLSAAHSGIELARRIGTKVLLWHTTWKNPLEHDPNPRKHVCPAAEKIIREAESLGRAAGVLDEDCRVECAATVVESIIRVALRSGASLVVMAGGKRKKFGAYPDRVRSRNCPVPLLILAREPS